MMKSIVFDKYIQKKSGSKSFLLFEHSRFAKNVASMLTGNLAAQFIVLLSAPLITRIYTPTQFGEMTLIWTYVALFSVITCLRYENCIVLEKNDEKAFNLFLACLVIALGVAVGAAIPVIILNESITEMIRFSGDRILLLFFPVGLLSFGAFNALTFLYTRFERFPLLSSCKVFGALSSVVFKILAGVFFYASAAWLLIGNTLVILVPVLILVLGLQNTKRCMIRKKSNLKAMTELLKKYKDFPVYHGVTGLINNLSQNIPVILFAYFFDSTVVGFYGLANSMLRKPVYLVSESLSKVFLKDIADKQDRPIELRRALIQTSRGLFLIGFIPFGTLMLFGQPLFILIFGESWAPAGLYTQLLSPWLFTAFINPPSTQMIIVKKKLKFNLYYNIANIVLKTLTVSIAAITLKDPVLMLGAFSGIGVAMNLFYMGYAFRLTGKNS